VAIASKPTIDVPTGTWIVDPVHSSVSFSVRHAGIANVHGVFREFEGALEVGPDGALGAAGHVELASVDTGAPLRDGHLRSADFFDVERHPRLTFHSDRIDVDGEDVLVAGRLSLHGVTNELELRGELLGSGVDDDGATRIGLSLSGALSRAAYGMRFNVALGGGNVLVGDKVKLALEISAVRGT
jgi:polyisoprenoid-binding protein YceI